MGKANYGWEVGGWGCVCVCVSVPQPTAGFVGVSPSPPQLCLRWGGNLGRPRGGQSLPTTARVCLQCHLSGTPGGAGPGPQISFKLKGRSPRCTGCSRALRTRCPARGFVAAASLSGRPPRARGAEGSHGRADFRAFDFILEGGASKHMTSHRTLDAESVAVQAPERS